MHADFAKKTVLWIRNYLGRIRIRILPSKPGQLNNWQVVIMRQLEGSKEICIFKDELDPFEEKFSSVI